MAVFLSNAFSLSMIDTQNGAMVGVSEISVERARALLSEEGFESAVGHADSAAVYSSILELPVAFNRVTVKLKSYDRLIVGQLEGGRLPEGCTTLPEGSSFKWLYVTV